MLSRGDGPEGGGDGDETTMEVHEQAWIRFGPVDAGAMYGLDGGLEMEAPELSRIMCRREVGSTAVDEGSVPRRWILLRQRDESAVGVGAAGEAGERHADQRGEAADLGLARTGSGVVTAWLLVGPGAVDIGRAGRPDLDDAPLGGGALLGPPDGSVEVGHVEDEHPGERLDGGGEGTVLHTEVAGAPGDGRGRGARLEDLGGDQDTSGVEGGGIRLEGPLGLRDHLGVDLALGRLGVVQQQGVTHCQILSVRPAPWWPDTP
ncbi:hypothetical protein BN11_1200022 [Nostocoides australiense Ben110]|uniref:Uncharacterized protein n=1 Tax=Nostocoides australiense Ben110 TaxID=1193182 RepID=W6K105_9MICO|nr:hypothetical protein BN11_1200022 [Tetrasphaera australiensis Ben110]